MAGHYLVGDIWDNGPLLGHIYQAVSIHSSLCAIVGTLSMGNRVDLVARTLHIFYMDDG